MVIRVVKPIGNAMADFSQAKTLLAAGGPDRHAGRRTVLSHGLNAGVFHQGMIDGPVCQFHLCSSQGSNQDSKKDAVLGSSAFPSFPSFYCQSCSSMESSPVLCGDRLAAFDVFSFRWRS